MSCTSLQLRLCEFPFSQFIYLYQTLYVCISLYEIENKTLSINQSNLVYVDKDIHEPWCHVSLPWKINLHTSKMRFDVWIFPVHWRMDLIFTVLPTGSDLLSVMLSESYEYQRILDQFRTLTSSKSPNCLNFLPGGVQDSPKLNISVHFYHNSGNLA